MTAKVGIVGLGMMGGSLAKLIRQSVDRVELVGVSDRDDDLRQAIADGVIDRGSESVSDLPSDVDIVFVCTPISVIPETVRAVKAVVGDHTVITDIGSVKQMIVSQLSDGAELGWFVPGHPMAGTDRTGYAASDAGIMSGARYVLVPCVGERYDRLKTFLTTLGFDVVEIAAEVHDRLVALSSHFPFVAACMTKGVAARLRGSENEALFESVVGPGFRDTTRVAGSDPVWGRDVCQSNADAMLDAIGCARDMLAELKGLIRDERWDDVEAFFRAI